MGLLNELKHADKKRNNEGGGHALRFLYIFRLTQCTRVKIIQIVGRLILRYYCWHYGLEIPWETKIGKGLYLGHAFNITINPNVVIGDYCNIHKGVLIGQQNRGKKKGCPTIGNKVWIGINAVIVGKITIGDDVLIAPNSYVNSDVPSHSIVLGNPCIIIPKENATQSYINNIS